MGDRGGRSGARFCYRGASPALAALLGSLAPLPSVGPLLAQAAPAAMAPLAADSALSRGDREGAIRLATTYTGRNPNDVRGWLVLGRARLAPSAEFASGQPLQALWAFRRASGLDPHSSEARVWMGRAGMTLGGADGESAARQAWEQVLSLDPANPEAWSEWLTLSRGRSERERVRRALAQFLDVRAARTRIARLLIEDERYDSANVLLDGLLRDDPVDGSVLALRAQSAFEAGDTAAGSRFYARALASAGRDPEDILWAQAIGIATPAEIRAWEGGVPAASRAAFLAGIWARRNPDLFRGENARIAEHFARLRYARKRYPLLHALTAYHRSAASRASELRPSPAEEAFYLMCEAQEWHRAPMRATDRSRLPFPEMGYWPSPAAWRDAHGVQIPGNFGLEPGSEMPLQSPFLRSLRDIDTTAVRAGYNLRTGLDDRGLTYLRLGPPAHRAIGAPNVEDAFCAIPDVERWDYPGIGQVRFFRPSAVSLGPAAGMRQTSDMVIRAQNEAQFSGMVAGLTRDTTSVPAPLPFGVWIAQFRGASDSSQVDLAVFATEGRVAGQLVGAAGVPGETVVGETGLAVLTAPPGPYSLLVHVRAADSLGRRTLGVRLRSFDGMKMSDLVAAPAWGDTIVSRTAMLERAARDLSFAADGVIRVYAEVYGLPRMRDGTVRYRASYQIVRTDQVLRDARRDSLAGGIVLSFERERPARGTTAVEWLDVTPDLPPGRCILRLTVTRLDGVVVGRSQFAFETIAR